MGKQGSHLCLVPTGTKDNEYVIEPRRRYFKSDVLKILDISESEYADFTRRRPPHAKGDRDPYYCPYVKNGKIQTGRCFQFSFTDLILFYLLKMSREGVIHPTTIKHLVGLIHYEHPIWSGNLDKRSENTIELLYYANKRILAISMHLENGVLYCSDRTVLMQQVDFSVMKLKPGQYKTEDTFGTETFKRMHEKEYIFKQTISLDRIVLEINESIDRLLDELDGD